MKVWEILGCAALGIAYFVACAWAAGAL